MASNSSRGPWDENMTEAIQRRFSAGKRNLAKVVASAAKRQRTNEPDIFSSWWEGEDSFAMQWSGFNSFEVILNWSAQDNLDLVRKLFHSTARAWCKAPNSYSMAHFSEVLRRRKLSDLEVYRQHPGLELEAYEDATVLETWEALKNFKVNANASGETAEAKLNNLDVLYEIAARTYAESLSTKATLLAQAEVSLADLTEYRNKQGKRILKRYGMPPDGYAADELHQAWEALHSFDFENETTGVSELQKRHWLTELLQRATLAHAKTDVIRDANAVVNVRQLRKHKRKISRAMDVFFDNDGTESLRTCWQALQSFDVHATDNGESQKQKLQTLKRLAHKIRGIICGEEGRFHSLLSLEVDATEQRLREQIKRIFRRKEQIRRIYPEMS